MSKRIKVIGISVIIIAVVIGAGYLVFYKYQQSQLEIKQMEGFSVKSESKNITLVGVKWLNSYIAQYQQKYVPRSKRIEEYEIDDIVVLDEENKIIQIDFRIETKVPVSDELDAQLQNGIKKESQTKYQWVLWFKTTEVNKEITYEVYKIQRPAAYDLEIYNTNGQKEKDEYEQEYIEEIPFKEKEYTYKIEHEKLYVSYDAGQSWAVVPVALETLVKVGDGNTYYNQLQEGSYDITLEKTAFVYGGTHESGLMIVYSDNQGETWNTVEVDSQMRSVRVKFCSFPTENVGYIIATGDRTMSQEAQVIYATKDGGISWTVAGYGPSTWLLQSGGFVDENIGFMSYPKVQGQETNIYRTEDGGATFSPVVIPVAEEWKEVFIEPQTPFEEDGKLSLLVGQGENGDFQGGRIMAKYQSDDMGITWEYVELVMPSSNEEG